MDFKIVEILKNGNYCFTPLFCYCVTLLSILPQTDLPERLQPRIAIRATIGTSINTDSSLNDETDWIFDHIMKHHPEVLGWG